MARRRGARGLGAGVSDVAVVHLGRAGARGEVRRVASWRAIFEAAGASVADVAVPRGRVPSGRALGHVLRGSTVPETLAWSWSHVGDSLRRLRPRVVIVVSSRAYRPEVASGPWRTVLDLVDRLDRSYADRAALLGPVRGAGYRQLSWAHARAQRHAPHPSTRLVAAGWRDARDLGAEWVPIVVDPALGEAGGAADHDLCFVGTLGYPPNVEAIRRLDRLWSSIAERRPSTTMLVAGSSPTPAVRAICARRGWRLLADFADVGAVMARGRCAVAPLGHTAGMQIKVLDAAALGLPQVVTSAALEGFAPGFPVQPVDRDADLVSEIVRVLSDERTARQQAAVARDQVTRDYGAAHWSEWARALL